MKKHPSRFKVLGEVAERNEKVGDEPVVLYEGETGVSLTILLTLLFTLFHCLLGQTLSIVFNSFDYRINRT